MYSSGGGDGYVAEKLESTEGWLFPVGDEVAELGYVDMFTDMFNAIEGGTEPQETFYDGYIVNAIMDAAYASAKSHSWEPVDIEWRAGSTPRIAKNTEYHDGHAIVKAEVLPDGRSKLILADKDTGSIFDVVTEA
jgi:hypothetical protein